MKALSLIFIVIGLLGALHAWKPELFRGARSESPSATPTVAKATAVRKGAAQIRRVIDHAGVIPSTDLPRFEDYLGWIMRESGVDVRFMFVRGTGSQSIEAMAVDVMDRLKIGGRTGQERGVLLLYDMQGQRLKIEIGYGLEGWLPDAFVSYLVNEHARMFFASGDISLGLRLMLRLLQHRIREAVIGNDFDPRALVGARALSHMSGGAGVSASLPITGAPGRATTGGDGAAYGAGSTPEESYRTYLQWLSLWPPPAQADLFTPASRAYLATMRLSPAYAEFILLAESGKAFHIEERGELALLVFTGTPFVSPHFFVKQGGLWRMDIAAEVRNTHEHVGGEYTWAYYGNGDPYTVAFEEKLTMIKGYRRLRDGDNRPLLIHGGG